VAQALACASAKLKARTMSRRPPANADPDGLNRSTRGILMLQCRAGLVWVMKAFDHIIRQEEELEENLRYLRQNPVTRGVVDHPDGYQ
jgi:hypothetical protein